MDTISCSGNLPAVSKRRICGSDISIMFESGGINFSSFVKFRVAFVILLAAIETTAVEGFVPRSSTEGVIE